MLALLSLLIALLFPSLAFAQVDWTQCAEEGSRCEFLGIKEVRYGANETYAMGQYTDGVDCNNEIFGDPLVGVGKQCEYRDIVVSNPPPDDSFPPWFNGVTLVPGTAMTWTDGKIVWARNPFCNMGGLIAETSPNIDKGILITGLDCPQPGSALNQPRLGDPWNSYCYEWYGAAPDIGACEFVPGGPPAGSLTVTIS